MEWYWGKMVHKQTTGRTSRGVYFSDLSQGSDQDVKLKLGLAELIFHALILFLLV